MGTHFFHFRKNHMSCNHAITEAAKQQQCFSFISLDRCGLQSSCRPAASGSRWRLGSRSGRAQSPEKKVGSDSDGKSDGKRRGTVAGGSHQSGSARRTTGIARVDRQPRCALTANPDARVGRSRRVPVASMKVCSRSTTRTEAWGQGGDLAAGTVRRLRRTKSPYHTGRGPSGARAPP